MGREVVPERTVDAGGDLMDAEGEEDEDPAGAVALADFPNV